MTFGMQLHILRWYVTATSTYTFMGTVHTDCMCCNHIVFLVRVMVRVISCVSIDVTYNTAQAY